MDKLTYLLFRELERGAKSPHFSQLEQQFPRIALRLVELWNSSACDSYLRQLLLDDRGDRAGFPADIMDDLIMLDSIHSELHLSGGPQSANSAFEFRFNHTTGAVAPVIKAAKPQGWIKRTFGL